MYLLSNWSLNVSTGNLQLAIMIGGSRLVEVKAPGLPVVLE